MKRLTTALLLLALALPSRATNVQVSVRDIASNPVANRTVRVTLTSPSGSAVAGPWAVAGDSVALPTPASGVVTFSNLLTQGEYRLDVSGNPSRSFPFSVGLTNLGTVSFVALLGTNNAVPMFYDTSQVDALVSGATNNVGAQLGQFIRNQSGTGFGTLTLTNNGPQLALASSNLTGTLTMDINGMTASVPLNGVTLNVVNANSTYFTGNAFVGGFFKGDISGCSNYTGIINGSVNATNAVGNNGGNGTNLNFYGITTFQPGGTLFGPTLPITASNITANGSMTVAGTMNVAGVITSLTISGGTIFANALNFQTSSGNGAGITNILAANIVPTVITNQQTNLTFGVAGLYGQSRNDSIIPSTNGNLWTVTAGSNDVFDLTSNSATFNVPVAGNGVGLTNVKASSLVPPVITNNQASASLGLSTGNITLTLGGGSIRGKNLQDSIRPEGGAAQGWVFIVNGSTWMEMSSANGFIQLNQPAVGTFTGAFTGLAPGAFIGDASLLTGIPGAQIVGNVPVVAATNFLTQTLVAGNNMNIVQSGNTFTFNSTAGGGGGSATNAVGNSGGQGTNNGFWGNITLNGNISGPVSGTLANVSAGNVTLAQLTNHVFWTNIDGLATAVIGNATNAQTATNAALAATSAQAVLGVDSAGKFTTNSITPDIFSSSFMSNAFRGNGGLLTNVPGSKVVGSVANSTNAQVATNLAAGSTINGANQISGNIPFQNVSNALTQGTVAGQNIGISTNSANQLVVSAIVSTNNSLLVPLGMTDYVSSAGYTFSNTVTGTYSSQDTNNNTTTTGRVTASSFFSPATPVSGIEAFTNAFNAGGPNTNQPQGEYGFSFFVNQDITVTALGRWIGPGPGFQGRRLVSLWGTNTTFTSYGASFGSANTTNTLLAQVVVDPTSVLQTNSYAYTALAKPVTLVSNHAYALTFNYLFTGDVVYGVAPISSTPEVTPLYGISGSANVFPVGFAGWAGLGFGVNMKFISTLNNPSTFSGQVTAPSFQGAIYGATEGYVGDVGKFVLATPQRAIEPFLDYACCLTTEANSQSNMLKWIFQLGTNGAGKYWNCIHFTDGWYATNHNRAVTPHITWDTNNIPNGIPWVVQAARSNGLTIGVYLQLGPDGYVIKGNSPTPTSYAYQDAYDIRSWGVKSVFVGADDPFYTGTDPAYAARVAVVQEESQRKGVLQLNYGAWAAKQLNADLADTNGWVISQGMNYAAAAHNTNYIFNQEDLMVANNYMFWAGDTNYIYNVAPGDIPAESLPFFMNALDTFKPYLRLYTRPGHFFSAESLPQWNVNGGTNTIRMAQELYANATISCYLPPLWFNPTNYGGQAYGYPAVLCWFTNAEFYGLWDDKAVIPGTEVLSNGLLRTWIKPLGGPATGSNMITFINMSTTNFTFNLSITNLPGAISNSLVLYRDPWSHTDIGSFSNTLSVTVGQTNTVTYWTRPAFTYSTNLIASTALQVGDLLHGIAPVNIGGSFAATGVFDGQGNAVNIYNSGGTYLVVAGPAGGNIQWQSGNNFVYGNFDTVGNFNLTKGGQTVNLTSGYITNALSVGTTNNGCQVYFQSNNTAANFSILLLPTGAYLRTNGVWKTMGIGP